MPKSNKRQDKLASMREGVLRRTRKTVSVEEASRALGFETDDFKASDEVSAGAKADETVPDESQVEIAEEPTFAAEATLGDGTVYHADGVYMMHRSRIMPGRNFGRKRYKQQAIEDLKENMLALREEGQGIEGSGIEQALKIRPAQSFNPKVTHEVIFGFQRWYASEKAGIEWLPVVEALVSDIDAIASSLTENILREDPDPADVGDGLELLQKEMTKYLEPIRERYIQLGEAAGGKPNWADVVKLAEGHKPWVLKALQRAFEHKYNRPPSVGQNELMSVIGLSRQSLFYYRQASNLQEGQPEGSEFTIGQVRVLAKAKNPEELDRLHAVLRYKKFTIEDLAIFQSLSEKVQIAIVDEPAFGTRHTAALRDLEDAQAKRLIREIARDSLTGAQALERAQQMRGIIVEANGENDGQANGVGAASHTNGYAASGTKTPEHTDWPASSYEASALGAPDSANGEGSATQEQVAEGDSSLPAKVANARRALRKDILELRGFMKHASATIRYQTDRILESAASAQLTPEEWGELVEPALQEMNGTWQRASEYLQEVSDFGKDNGLREMTPAESEES